MKTMVNCCIISQPKMYATTLLVATEVQLLQFNFENLDFSKQQNLLHEFSCAPQKPTAKTYNLRTSGIFADKRKQAEHFPIIIS